MILNLINSIKHSLIRLFAPATKEISRYDTMYLSDAEKASARLATPEKDSEILIAVSELSAKLGQPPPKVVIYRNSQPNATWVHNSGNGTILVTTGQIENHSIQEIKTILAHELIHKQQRFASTLGKTILDLPAVAAGVAITSYAWKKARKPNLSAVTTLAGAAIYEVSSRIADIFMLPVKAWYSRQLERDADRGGLILMDGDLEAFKSRQQKYDLWRSEQMQKATESIPSSSPASESSVSHPVPPENMQHKTQNKSLKQKWKHLLRGHPDSDERLSHLERVKQQIDAGEIKGDKVSRFF